MKISRRDPIKAWLVMDALKEETRQKIIQLLLKHGELTLTEIQKTVKKTLPTLLFHMSALEKAGIVTWRNVKKGKKTTKAYSIKTKLISMEIDIELFTKIVNLKNIEDLAKKVIEKFIEKGKKIKKKFDISEIMDTAGLKAEEALIVKDFIETHEDIIAKYLYNRFSDIINETNDPIEIAENIGVDVYWAARILQQK